MFIKLVIILGASILSGILYYIGGQGKIAHSKAVRRFGCSLLFLALFIALKGVSALQMAYILPYTLTYILNAIALSTYHDYIGYDCWWLTGAGYGLAAIPLLWCGIALWAIIGRAIFLALTIWWLRSRTGKVFIEEFFSGFLYCASIPILLI